MSYCRFGEGSDVYLYRSMWDEWVCASCALTATISTIKCLTLEETALHLLEHDGAGHSVPEHAWERLYRELQNGRFG